MAQTKEVDHFEILKTCNSKSVAELSKEVDALITKAISGKATKAEKKRAAVLAGVILDRTSMKDR
jgi:hypothetical protein